MRPSSLADLAANATPAKAGIKRSSSVSLIVAKHVDTVDQLETASTASGTSKFSDASSLSNATSIKAAMNKRLQSSFPARTARTCLTGSKEGQSLSRATASGWSGMASVPGLMRGNGFFEASASGDLPALRKLFDGGLLSNRPEINGRDATSKTALMHAVTCGNRTVIEYLLVKRADVQAVDSSKRSALHHASKRGKVRRGPEGDASQAEAVTLLVRAKAALEARDHNGCTALMVAVENGIDTVIEKLLRSSADASARDNEGQSSLDYAERFENRGLLEMLKMAQEVQLTEMEPPASERCIELKSESESSDDEVEAEPVKEIVMPPSTPPRDVQRHSNSTMSSPLRSMPDPPQAASSKVEGGHIEDVAKTADKLDKPRKSKSEKADKLGAEMADKAEKSEKVDKPDKDEKSEKAEKKKKKASIAAESVEVVNEKKAEAPPPPPEPKADPREIHLSRVNSLMESCAGSTMQLEESEERIKELKAAIKAAQESGVEEKDLEKAESFMNEIKSRNKAQQKLQQAMADKEWDKLPKVITKAEEANVPRKIIDEAVQLLEKQGPKAVARNALKAALDADTAEALRAALESCRAAGLDEGELASAEKALSGAEAREKAEHKLHKAIAEKDVGKLQKALAKAEEAQVSKTVLDKARKVLAEEGPKQKAREQLQAAKDAQDIAQLKAAIAGAKEVGLDAAEIGEFEKLQNALESKEKAEALLRKAIEEKSVSKLKSAIEAANEAGADSKLLKQAQKVLKEEEPKEKARIQLAEAIAKRTIPELKEAIEAAQGAKLDPTEYSQAAEILRKEEEREKTMEAVRQAVLDVKDVDMTSIDALKEAKEKLGAAVQAATQAGVGESHLVEAETRRKKLHNTIEDLKGSIRVFCRVRPLSSKEKGQGDTTVTKQLGSMGLEVDGSPAFHFDAVFTPGTQDEVFEDCKDLVQSAVDGYNVTMFAYGQTGAGKTFTMYGVPGQEGTAPRTIEELFRVIEVGKSRFSYEISGSMLELYCNGLVDLLSKGNPAAAKAKLNIRQEKSGAVTVEHLTEETVQNAKELRDLLDRGNDQRTVAATAMNSESSRSHLVLIIKICSTNKDTNQSVKGKILICDLAGSERLKKSGVEGSGQSEAIEINKSLTALGDVMMALTAGGAKQVIPYRNHKLTQLMQDSLGGTAKTLMFVNCSPASSNTEETVMSLKYATRAKKITNTAKKGS